MNDPKVFNVNVSFRGTVEAETYEEARIEAIDTASTMLERYEWDITEAQP